MKAVAFEQLGEWKALVVTTYSKLPKTSALNCNFDKIPVKVKDNALKIPIACGSRWTSDLKTVAFEQLGEWKALVVTTYSKLPKTSALNCNFDKIPVKVKDNALKIPIACGSRWTSDLKTVAFEQLGEWKALVVTTYSKLSKTSALNCNFDKIPV
ncbi:MAG: hypothetical protein ACI4JT_09510 [Oscillospiraceae bacterium]